MSLASTPISSVQKAAFGYESAEHVVLDRLKRYGLPSAVAGAGLAVAMKVVSDIRENQLDARAKRKEVANPNTIEIHLPPKTLGEQKKIAESVSRSVSNAVRRSKQKRASLPAYQVAACIDHNKKDAGGALEEIGGFISGLGGKPDPSAVPQHWALSTPATIGAAVLPGVGAYMLLDKMFKGQERKALKKQIKAVKDDYSNLLLRDIESQRNPDQEKVACSPSEALIDVLVDRRSDADGMSKTASWWESLTSAPVALALLAGVMTHRYSLGKEREVDEYYSKLKKPGPRPPQRVKLISAPPATEAPGAEPTAAKEEAAEKSIDNETQKAANVTGPALLGLKLFEMSDRNEPDGLTARNAARESEEAVLAAEQAKELSETKPFEQVDHNTLILNTPAGRVVVDAADPDALEYLNANKEQLRDSMADVSESDSASSD